VETGIFQMGAKGLHHSGEILTGVIVANGITSALPDMFLRIAWWTTGWQMKSFKLWMLTQIFMHHTALVPFGAIP